jgi:hypothetical protein
MEQSQMTYSTLLNQIANGLGGSSFLDIKTKLNNNYYDGYAIAPFSGKKVKKIETSQYICCYSKRLNVYLRFDKTQLIDLPHNPILMHNLIKWIEDSIIAGIRMPYPKILRNSFIHNTHIDKNDEDEDEDENEDEDEDDDDEDDLDGFIVSDDVVEYEPRKKIKI